MLTTTNLNDFLNQVAARDAHQPEFLQAVEEILCSLWPFIQANPQYAAQGLLERLVEPERIIQFRISWVDDHNRVQVNRGYRVQFNSAIGPFKGGMRFHPSVNLSILKFLAFEQIFKNALTTLPMGGGKGGSDFDPKGKSDGEIMRFCQAMMIELYRHLGADTDVPAGDIGVGAREVGYMVGMMKKLSNRTDCVFTGKGLAFGGSLLRPEATGYGCVYFTQEMLATRSQQLAGQRIAISGSGNVAKFAAQKAIELGAHVVTLSDSTGMIYVKDGINHDLLNEIIDLKDNKRGRLSELAQTAGVEYVQDRQPWDVPVDIAMPCATQNELNDTAAQTLLHNGCHCVAEGANMPSTLAAAKAFLNAKILYAPAKACNAGGVATSGLEMAQNSQRLNWSYTEVDQHLHQIMRQIHDQCVEYGQQHNDQMPDDLKHSRYIHYVNGANIAAFVKLSNAMQAQGIY